ncbi:MAG: hypothetical protein ACRC42_02570, partial [Mycoplasma sp.]
SMPQPRLKWDKFIVTKEYDIWKDLQRVCDEYNISGSKYIVWKDIGGVFWEPLWDRILKWGECFKNAKKWKTIKMDWMRPLLYLESTSNEKVVYDGMLKIVDKNGLHGATQLAWAFRGLLDSICTFNNLSEENWKENYKQWRLNTKYYFTKLNKFIKENGFRIIHEHLKSILYPLRMLRKSGYRLFSLEKKELNYADLTLYKDKQFIQNFTKSIDDDLKWSAFKATKTCDREKLNEFLKLNTDQNKLRYMFDPEIRKEDPNKNKTSQSGDYNPYATQTFNSQDNSKELPNINKMGNQRYTSKKVSQNTKEEQKKLKQMQDRYSLLNPNIKKVEQNEPTRFMREAYQLQFEQGIAWMITYLNERMQKDFPFLIDTHKIFVNWKYVPNGRETPQTNYYLEQLDNKIEECKIKCYEMKLNGISRVLIPITKNREIIEIIKDIYDYHDIVDNILGSYWLYEQYMFFHQKIKMIQNSSVKDQLKNYQTIEFQERIQRYIVFESLCHSVNVWNRMIDECKENLEKIKYENYYQLSKHNLSDSNNVILDSYELFGDRKKYSTPEWEEKKGIYYQEIKKYGRFWIMEGIFPKEDQQLWFQAVERWLLVNELVREDIRDNILSPYAEENIDHVWNERKFSSNSLKKTTKSIKIQKSNKNTASIKKTTKRRNSNSSYGESIDLQRVMPQKFDGLRPPNVWNYPIYKLQEIKNRKLMREYENYTPWTEIRNVEPTKCYNDGRIESFYELFNEICLHFSDFNKKNCYWDYFWDKILIVLMVKPPPIRVKEKYEEDIKKDEEKMWNELKAEIDNPNDENVI